MGKSVDDSSDEMPQGEVVYDVPSVADILLLLQRSTPPMHLRHGSAHSVAMPPASQCGVGGNATALSPREVMSVQVHAGSKSAPAPPQPQHQHTDTRQQHTYHGLLSASHRGTPACLGQTLLRRSLLLTWCCHSMQPSFTKGSTLSSSERTTLHAG